MAARLELGPQSKARGVRLLSLDEIDSTNDEAKRLVADGELGPLWIVAERQTNGRGRLGRQWISQVGNLHASLIISNLADMRDAPQLGFVAGVAVMEALQALTGAGRRLALKWPNDILLDGGKLSGILLEGVAAPQGLVAIVGVGVNCAHAPQALPYETRALTDLGAQSPSPAQLLPHLCDAFVKTLELWDRDGFAAVRARWLTHAAGVGEDIRVTLARETIEGVFETIDRDGRLILSVAGQRRVVEAGDVFLARAGATFDNGVRPLEN